VHLYDKRDRHYLYRWLCPPVQGPRWHKASARRGEVAADTRRGRNGIRRHGGFRIREEEDPPTRLCDTSLSFGMDLLVANANTPKRHANIMSK
jgi:hypothetical protein